MKASLSLLALSAVLTVSPPAFAEKANPKDFFCRELGSADPSQTSNTSSIVTTLAGNSMGAPPSVAAALRDPQMQKFLNDNVGNMIRDPHILSGGACGKEKSNSGTCQQLAECAYIDPKIQADVVKRYVDIKKQQNEITPAQANGLQFSQVGPPSLKQKLIDASAKIGTGTLPQWLLSNLDCPWSGNASNGTAVCPLPDNCKSKFTEGSAKSVSLDQTQNDDKKLYPLIDPNDSNLNPGSDNAGGAI